MSERASNINACLRLFRLVVWRAYNAVRSAQVP